MLGHWEYWEYWEYCQNIARILPEYCQNIARILGILPEYCQNIARILWILPEYWEYCQNIARILWILPEYWEYFQNIGNIVSKNNERQIYQVINLDKTVNISISSGILLERSDDLSTVLPERSSDLHFRVRALRRSNPTSWLRQ